MTPHIPHLDSAPNLYTPNFGGECHVCGASPTVIVRDHLQPETDLCGSCFFNDRAMVDWELWNDTEEDSE